MDNNISDYTSLGNVNYIVHSAIEKDSQHKKHSYKTNDYFQPIPSTQLISNEGIYALNVSTEECKIVINVNDMVNRVRDILGVNPSQLSKILGLSRATIYNHLGDNHPPLDLAPYKKIYKLAIKIESNYGSLKRGLKSVLVKDKTLLQHLQSNFYNDDEIMDVAKVVFEKIQNTKQKSGLSSHQQRLVVSSSI